MPLLLTTRDRLHSKRRFRGSMVIKDVDDFDLMTSLASSSASSSASARRRLSRRPSLDGRRSRTRTTTSPSPTLKQALFYLAAALEPYRLGAYTDDVFSLIAAYCKNEDDITTPMLTLADMDRLNGAFNVIHHDLHDLFSPNVETVHMTESDALDVLNVPLIVDTVLDVERHEFGTLSKADQAYAPKPMKALLALLGASRRRRTV